MMGEGLNPFEIPGTPETNKTGSLQFAKEGRKNDGILLVNNGREFSVGIVMTDDEETSIVAYTQDGTPGGIHVTPLLKNEVALKVAYEILGFLYGDDLPNGGVKLVRFNERARISEAQFRGFCGEELSRETQMQLAERIGHIADNGFYISAE